MINVNVNYISIKKPFSLKFKKKKQLLRIIRIYTARKTHFWRGRYVHHCPFALTLNCALL